MIMEINILFYKSLDATSQRHGHLYDDLVSRPTRLLHTSLPWGVQLNPPPFLIFASYSYIGNSCPNHSNYFLSILPFSYEYIYNSLAAHGLANYTECCTIVHIKLLYFD